MKISAAGCWIGIGLVASCVSCTSPPSRFYTLSALTAPSSAQSTLAIAVGPISIPEVVDRPEFVVGAGDNELMLDEFNRWASPLEDNLGRVVAGNLVALLGTPQVTQFPSAVTAPADFRVAIEVQRFDSTPGESATFEAVWTVNRVKDGVSNAGRTAQHEHVLDEGYGALAAAHSRSVARMSEEIARVIDALR